jgi:hypothetical protein
MGQHDFDNFFGFEEYFYHDLEKAFSADIACCDACYEDFVAMWPHAYSADDCCFQTQEIDLKWFYQYGYLREEFSEDEFDHYIAQIECPRCGRPLAHTIWAYNFPFDIPESFEDTIKEVGELARNTPFLLLTHEFCQGVFAALTDLSTEVTSVLVDQPLFRARSTLSGNLAESVECFDFPPAKFVQEGRYNHAGSPVLYLASDKETCHAELKGEPCLVLEFKLLSPIRILDLSDPFSAHHRYSDLLNSLVYSALVSSSQGDDGWHKPHYVVSRFVADCARAAGFDAIKYPSTRRSGTNFNLVLVNSSMSLASNAQIVAYHRMMATLTK